MDQKEQIKAILLEHFIQTDDPNELTNDTPLISSGVLDSISILQMVDIIEKTFNVAFDAHEIDREYFDSINRIDEMVSKKMGG